MHLAAVPCHRHRPRLFERQRAASRLAPFRAPAVDMLLTTEEQHRFSGEYDVLPPAPGRDGEMDDRAHRERFAILNLDRQSLAATGTGCLDRAVAAEHPNHTERIPRAGGEERLVSGAHLERSRH